ncbi:GntR family transcriptional regulator [Oceanimonas sp. GK1]|uniref:GntR family transcriptional regulator n=1 Tax=Oceanimonas sp. (strain GK1 / IBRC-M 10197) TaxID=511062 RepID=UPI0002494BC1|nr:GntR family transcriptional regulator [Oceanimonas sp. GK1]AEY00007.1 GntR family transcriptional regulator [Oceanimonas sp. GK1]
MNNKNKDLDKVYQRIWEAIVAHKLLPGTRLKEEELCDTFGLSRGFVRKLLLQLSYHKLVNLVPNSGAFVAEPSPEEARDIFQARRLIEAELVRELASKCTLREKKLLQEHLEKEHQAAEQGDQSLRIRLSGEFHLLIGKLANKPVLTSFLHEIIPRSSLIVALYQNGSRKGHHHGTGPSCSEHNELLEAIAGHHIERAVTLMIDHLNEIEAQLQLEPPAEEDVNLKHIFAEL